MKNRRIGKFRIGSDLIEGMPEIVKEIMGKCIILKASASYDLDAIEYIAISDCFELILRDTEPPRYHIQIDFTGTQLNWMFF